MLFSNVSKLRRGPYKYLLAIFLLNIYLLWRQFSAVKHKNPHDFNYLSNPGSKICGSDPVSILILVTSGLRHGDRRAAIRQSWGHSSNTAPHKARVVFLLGNTASPNPGLQQEIMEEESGHGDIVREDFLDTYQNLTLKTLAGVKWAGQFCHQAEFVMKTDDDMYVNLDTMMEYLRREHSASHKVITGCVKNDPNGPHKPLAAGGQAPPLPFKSVHPLFMAGAGYVLTGDLVMPLFTASLDIRLVRVEDAFLTGYCARKVGGVRKVHHDKFSCGELVAEDCDMARRFTGHKVTPDRMNRIHDTIREGKC